MAKTKKKTTKKKKKKKKEAVWRGQSGNPFGRWDERQAEGMRRLKKKKIDKHFD